MSPFSSEIPQPFNCNIKHCFTKLRLERFLSLTQVVPDAAVKKT